MSIGKLSNVQCRSAKPKDRLYKLWDGAGLSLVVLPSGSKSWRLAYKFGGKAKRLTLGRFPAVGLAGARDERDQARRLIRSGVDPAEKKKQEKLARDIAQGTTFKVIAEELLAKDKREAKAENTNKKKRWLLLDLASPLAARPIAEITTPELLRMLRKVEARGKFETARRLRSACSQVFRYGIQTGRCERDPAADLKGALTMPTVTHRPALSDPNDIGALWRSIDGFTGQPETRLALKFALLTAARPGEVRHAEWSEIDLDAREWRVPAAKMKMRRDWRVWLSDQAMAVLAELKPLTKERGKFLFPSIRTVERPMSEATILAALRRMGYGKEQLCGHGFRGTFSTFANESGRWKPDAIEASLAHQDENAVRRAYNHAEHWPERQRLSQWWANELDRLAKAGTAKVFALKETAQNESLGLRKSA